MASMAGSKGGISKEFQKRLIEISTQKENGDKKSIIEADRKKEVQK